MFTAALFTIARSCKQPKCPSTDEQGTKIPHATWYGQKKKKRKRKTKTKT